MSLSALNASIAGAPPLAEHPRDLGGKSADGSKFAAIMSALAGEDPQPNARAAGAAAAAGGQDSVSPSESAAMSNELPSIDAGLAGLLSGALGSTADATPGQIAPPGAGKQSVTQQNASGSTSGGSLWRALADRSAAVSANAATDASAAAKPSQFFSRDAGRTGGAAANSDTATVGAAAATPAPTANGADANVMLAGLVFGAFASPVAAASGQFVPRVAGGVSSLAAAGGGSATNSDQATGPLAASLATTAGSDVASNFGLAGVADAPLTMQMATNGDSSLGARVLQSRTYLGVDNAARGEAGKLASRSAAAAPAPSDTAGTVGADTAAAASTRNETSSEKEPASDHGKTHGAVQPDQSSVPAAAAVGANASSGVVNAQVNPAMMGAGPVACDQLADRLAAEASDLTSQPAAAEATSATGGVKAQAVKELQIELNPADLGAVSVTMRMAQGQLSVVMEVAKSSTLKSIESERDAITDRLGLSAQSLEIVIGKPTTTNQSSAESNNASDQKPGSQENAQSDSNRASQGNEQQPSRRENASGRWNRQAAAQPSPSRRSFGDLLV